MADRRRAGVVAQDEADVFSRHLATERAGERLAVRGPIEQFEEKVQLVPREHSSRHGAGGETVRAVADGVWRRNTTRVTIPEVEAVIRWLLWDDFNVVHIARHQVTPAEVEQVVYLDERALAFEDDRHRPGRLIVLGVTTQVRPLFVALDAPTGMGDRYVVTARPMTVKEEQLYEEEAP